MLPQTGKLDRATFDKYIFPYLGHKDQSVIIGPEHGVDAAVIELPDGNAMVIAEDPTFGMPVIMPHFGWAIVHICASDVAVLGVPPRYLTICLLLPVGTPVEVLEHTWMEMHRECDRLGIAIVGGHTGVAPGLAFPLNGGCTVIGIGLKERLTPASNAIPGDRIIITKGPAIEATALLAMQAEVVLREKIGNEIVQKGKDYFFRMTVVEDALTAAPLAHAMHDATEGGLLNGVYEMAAASGAGVNLYEEKIPLPPEVKAICGHFGIDPLRAISEGTLVISAPVENTAAIISALKQKGIAAWEVGEVTPKERLFIRGNGKKEALQPVMVDPFWAAYFSALEVSP
jgi:hydrogenase expression/formation protein HypE